MPLIKSVPLDQAYEQAFSDAVFIQRQTPGLVILRGADRLDLLNRISTNDVHDLPPGGVRRTILTTPLARIVDVLTLFSRDDELLLLTSPGRAASVKAWIQGYIFFQDDVQISSTSPQLEHWGIYGPNSNNYMNELPFRPANLEPDRFEGFQESILWPVSSPAPGGFEFLVGGGLQDQLRKIAKRLKGNLPEQELFEILRIESGLPRFGAEISQETIPLEVGLWDEVSFQKGCYTGQEILARMESRGQIARRLVLVGMEAELEPGEIVRSGKRDLGQITSVVQTPSKGWIGLALMKPDAFAIPDIIAGANRTPIYILDRLQGDRVSKAV